MFALGNRQYEHFCAVGNKVHTALLELGASPIVNVGEGDDDEDIEADFDGWKAGLLTSLDNSFLVSKSKVQYMTTRQCQGTARLTSGQLCSICWTVLMTLLMSNSIVCSLCSKVPAAGSIFTSTQLCGTC